MYGPESSVYYSPDNGANKRGAYGPDYRDDELYRILTDEALRGRFGTLEKVFELFSAAGSLGAANILGNTGIEGKEPVIRHKGVALVQALVHEIGTKSGWLVLYPSLETQERELHKQMDPIISEGWPYSWLERTIYVAHGKARQVAAVTPLRRLSLACFDGQRIDDTCLDMITNDTVDQIPRPSIILSSDNTLAVINSGKGDRIIEPDGRMSLVSVVEKFDKPKGFNPGELTAQIRHIDELLQPPHHHLVSISTVVVYFDPSFAETKSLPPYFAYTGFFGLGCVNIESVIGSLQSPSPRLQHIIHNVPGGLEFAKEFSGAVPRFQKDPGAQALYKKFIRCFGTPWHYWLNSRLGGNNLFSLQESFYVHVEQAPGYAQLDIPPSGIHMFAQEAFPLSDSRLRA